MAYSHGQKRSNSSWITIVDVSIGFLHNCMYTAFKGQSTF